jgi:hypothetical protein
VTQKALQRAVSASRQQSARAAAAAGTQFTWFTGTKVQTTDATGAFKKKKTQPAAL